MKHTKHLKRFGRDFNELDQNLATRWRCLRQRCYSPNHPNFNVYGARGITVADEFRNDVVAFINYMRELPGADIRLTIDRIDPNRGYERGNLRWATRKQQSRNLRTAVRTSDGESVRDAAERECPAFNSEWVAKSVKKGKTVEYFKSRVKGESPHWLRIPYAGGFINAKALARLAQTRNDYRVVQLARRGFTGEEILRHLANSRGRRLRYSELRPAPSLRDAGGGPV